MSSSLNTYQITGIKPSWEEYTSDILVNENRTSILICLDMFVVIIKICILILALIFSTWIAEESWENLWKPLKTFKALRDLVA